MLLRRAKAGRAMRHSLELSVDSECEDCSGTGLVGEAPYCDGSLARDQVICQCVQSQKEPNKEAAKDSLTRMMAR